MSDKLHFDRNLAFEHRFKRAREICFQQNITRWAGLILLKVTSDYNLGKLNPDLAKEWHPSKNGDLAPLQVSWQSNMKVWWLCNRGHEWQATVSNRAYLGRGCPYCAGKRATKDNNSLALYHKLARQWHSTKNGDLKPSSILLIAVRKFGSIRKSC